MNDTKFFEIVNLCKYELSKKQQNNLISDLLSMNYTNKERLYFINILTNDIYSDINMLNTLKHKLKKEAIK